MDSCLLNTDNSTRFIQDNIEPIDALLGPSFMWNILCWQHPAISADGVFSLSHKVESKRYLLFKFLDKVLLCWWRIICSDFNSLLFISSSGLNVDLLNFFDIYTWRDFASEMKLLILPFSLVLGNYWLWQGTKGFSKGCFFSRLMAEILMPYLILILQNFAVNINDHTWLCLK